ncbi:PQQ-dependent sugar dehydrogenase [Gilvimarinus sp. F26214L]|uniref:PQQ-dependent sugar dehydrogenase n=1 Tax=Gilvimarinus sp. DZF01 TaxID=3461371 RepID=UPI004045B9DE
MPKYGSAARLVIIPAIAWLAGCGSTAKLPLEAGVGPEPELPDPNPAVFPTINVAPAVGWTEGRSPQARDGLEVIAFAQDLDHPRWLYVLPNGDVLVAESNKPPVQSEGFSIRQWMMQRTLEKAGAAVPSANRITLLRDNDGDGVADERHVFLENLHSPFGMALVDENLYVANTDALLRFTYSAGQERIEEQGETLVRLPAGPINYHWTKNVIASPDGSTLYVSVGSNSNVAENGLENEEGRAAIWAVDRETGEHRIFASGLRNPVGMTWVPQTEQLWTVVNERDELGSDLVPDFMTSVQDGAFYGWPFSYYGQNVDERVEPQRPDRVAESIKPDYALGAHTASLGIVYTDNSDSLQHYGSGVYIGQHGSWNRKPFSGYRVIFVPFSEGKPLGMPKEVLTGFLNDKGEAMGRPVGVVIDGEGDLLVADDVGNTVWRVRGTDGRGMPISSSNIWRVAENRPRAGSDLQPAFSGTRSRQTAPPE